MALSPDARGLHEVTAPLGAGGMGEVYRATAQTTAVVMEPVECPTLADLIAGSGLKAQGLGLDDGIKIPISSVVMAQVADGWSAL